MGLMSDVADMLEGVSGGIGREEDSLDTAVLSDSTAWAISSVDDQNNRVE